MFILDDSQQSYADVDLWHNWSPIIIPHKQRVTLRAIQHEDGLPSAGLFFSRVEFDDLVSTMYPPPQYRSYKSFFDKSFFDKAFFDELFDLTDGHVGAIVDFIWIILAHEVGPSPSLVMI